MCAEVHLDAALATKACVRVFLLRAGCTIQHARAGCGGGAAYMFGVRRRDLSPWSFF